MRAVWDGVTVAEGDEVRECAGWRYFPRDAVRMELLRAVPHSERDLQCPHGVRFFDVVDGERVATRAAWTYESPRETHEAVRDWIGFWHEVELTP